MRSWSSESELEEGEFEDGEIVDLDGGEQPDSSSTDELAGPATAGELARTGFDGGTSVNSGSGRVEASITDELEGGKLVNFGTERVEAEGKM